MAEVIIHLWKWFSVHSQTPFRHSWSHLADNNTGYLWASLHSMWEPMGTKCPQALSVIPAGLHKRNLPCTAFLLLFNPTRLSLFFFFPLRLRMREKTDSRQQYDLGHKKPSSKHSQIHFSTFCALEKEN